MKSFHAENLDQWRAWLTEHHASETEVWLIFHKLHTGRASIGYQDALDEALCFGWVDSLIKRLDDDRYARKFTPRKPDSKWSAINRQRYAELEAEGRIMPPGRDRPPTDRTYDPRPELPASIPDYVEQRLRENPAVWARFECLSPSERRRYVGWIHLGKQEATRQRRLEEVVHRLEAGEPLGLK